MHTNSPQSIRRVLVIGYVWPEPTSSAAGWHMLGLLKLFTRQGWEVHFASPALKGEHKADLNSMNVTEHEINLNCSSFDDFLTKLCPEMVMFDRFMMEEQFGWRVSQHCPKALKLLDTEDLHFLRQARHQAVKQERKVSLGDLCNEMAKREIASIYRCDLTLILSDFEKHKLQETFRVPSYLLHHCPFMIEFDPDQPTIPAFSKRAHFISIGNFRHAPNWDAVLQLKQQLWPAIRRRLPKAELHIYGAYCPPKATQLHNPAEGFMVKGWTEDAHAVMSAARICLAPLRFGAGIKGKLVDAMWCGTPSVTTPTGAEGMYDPEHDQWPGYICANDHDFVEAAVSLYETPALWETCQESGFALLQQRYQYERNAQALTGRIQDTWQHLEQHRLHNFTGAMLQHHHHKSTQYMAQWIEAKNNKSLN